MSVPQGECWIVAFVFEAGWPGKCLLGYEMLVTRDSNLVLLAGLQRRTATGMFDPALGDLS